MKDGEVSLGGESHTLHACMLPTTGSPVVLISFKSASQRYIGFHLVSIFEGNAFKCTGVFADVPTTPVKYSQRRKHHDSARLTTRHDKPPGCVHLTSSVFFELGSMTSQSENIFPRLPACGRGLDFASFCQKFSAPIQRNISRLMTVGVLKQLWALISCTFCRSKSSNSTPLGFSI